MTPAQRKYDQDLAGALRNMAQWIDPRSRKISLTLKLAADRIEALTTSMPIDPVKQLDPDGLAQPVSTSEQAGNYPRQRLPTDEG